MEPLELRDRHGVKLQAEAEVHRLSEAWRIGRSLLIAGAGITLGLGSMIIPPHIPWVIGFSSVGVFVGGYMLRQGVRIGAVHATCLGCTKEFTSEPVGALYEDTWVRCPHCKQPYQMRLLAAS